MKNSLLLMFMFHVGMANGQSASKVATAEVAGPVQAMPALPMPLLASTTLEIVPLLRISLRLNCWMEFSSIYVLSHGIPAQYNSLHFEPNIACQYPTVHAGYFHDALIRAVKRAQSVYQLCGLEAPTLLMPHPQQINF
ncbi:MAG: hypothetical protein C0424_02120 [Sphingobacteriaceae bacterium]|nr:hypothetical protein [Sphingobacteriaceae bacterium]